MANGVSSAGASAGVLLMPLFLHWSVDEYGYRGSFILLGALVIQCVVVMAMVRSIEDTSSDTGHTNNDPQIATVNLVHYQVRDPNCSSSSEVRSGLSQNQLPENDDNDTQVKTSNQSTPKASTSRPVPSLRHLTRSPMFILDSLIIFLALFASSGHILSWPLYAAEKNMDDWIGSLSLTVLACAELLFRPLIGGLINTLSQYKRIVFMVCCVIAFGTGLVMTYVTTTTMWLSMCAVFGASGTLVTMVAMPILGESVKTSQLGFLSGFYGFLLGISNGASALVTGKLRYTSGHKS